jgi:hypothetical protein
LIAIAQQKSNLKAEMYIRDQMGNPNI